MKQINNMIATLAFLSISLLSCNKDTTKPNKEASEYFPNKVGNYWEYEVYDSSDVLNYPVLGKQYTVKISITGIQKLIDGKDANVWNYEYPDRNVIVFVRIINDSVRIYSEAALTDYQSLKYGKTYIIPFTDYQKWSGLLLAIDSFFVKSYPMAYTKWNTFKDCFKIYHHYVGPNTEYNDEEWFKPTVGFIKLHYTRYNLAPLTIELWQLKKYYLQ
jgi:hypothetical protein